MCDYSLSALASRPAKVGDKLTTTHFTNTTSKGFSSVDDINVAVCVLPGSEIAFDDNITTVIGWATEAVTYDHKVAIFRQVDTELAHTHHDALEMPDGKIVKLNDLAIGQSATVLQLPAAPKTPEEVKSQERLEVVA